MMSNVKDANDFLILNANRLTVDVRPMQQLVTTNSSIYRSIAQSIN